VKRSGGKGDREGIDPYGGRDAQSPEDQGKNGEGGPKTGRDRSKKGLRENGCCVRWGRARTYLR